MTLLLFLFVCYFSDEIQAQSPMYFNPNILGDICGTIDYNTEFGNENDVVNAGIFHGLIAVVNLIYYTSYKKGNTEKMGDK